MRVLVGFDGSEGARDAIALTRVFCTGDQDAALLVSVLPHGGPLPVAYRLLGYEESEDSKRLVDEARTDLHDLEIETRTYTGGSPAFVLSDLAEEEQVDLIVIGSPHRGAIGRALIGSVAEGLLHGATIPTVAAPRGYAQAVHSGFNVIGVAYDGSPESKLALVYAQGLAVQSGATIRILSVQEPIAAMPGAVGYTPPPQIDPQELIDEALETIDVELEAVGYRLVGPIAAGLAGACEDGVDILIAGSRGYGPAGRVLLGSVSTQLIHKAPCPVLVVPRGKKSNEGHPAASGVGSRRSAAA
jgi:nucleotide-binding universal stress UspA family protein